MKTCEKQIQIQTLIRIIILIVSVSYSGCIFGQLVSEEQVGRQLLMAARANIEKYRKGDAIITILDKNGKKLKNVEVEVNQLTQDFLFGNLSEEIFHPGLTPEEVMKFKKYFTNLFNFTELTVKWTPYKGAQGRSQWSSLQKKLDWCRENNVISKGHTLGKETKFPDASIWLLPPMAKKSKSFLMFMTMRIIYATLLLMDCRATIR